MKKSIATTVAVFAAVVVMASFANAQMNQLQPAAQQTQMQQSNGQQAMTQGAFVGQPQTRVAPFVSPMPNKYYFGMQLQLVRGYGGTTLRVVSVTPGSPAHLAGLEYGDEIRMVNGQGFQHARDSFDAVSMMNRYVDTWAGGGGPAPAVAAASAGAATSYYQPMPAPAPTAQMVVRNVRNGQDVYVSVRPHRKGWSGPAPAAPAAPAVAAPAVSAMQGG